MSDRALCERLSLMVITDPAVAGGVLPIVEAALRGGATAVQLRWKDGATRDQLRLALALREATRTAGALLIVNDRVDIALACEADGAHLGDGDLPLAVARRVAPPGFLLGRSVDTLEQAVAAERDGADYLGLGPVFPTATKSDTGAVVGREAMARACRAVSLPIVGIGGIGTGRVAQVISAGACGVAVVSAIMNAVDPEAEASRLRGEVESARRRGQGAAE